MKSVLLYLSFQSVFVSEARYSRSDMYVPSGNAYGDVFEEVRNMEAMPSFRSVNTCATAYGISAMPYACAPVYHTAPMEMANGTIRTMATDLNNGTLAAVQPLYTMQYGVPVAQPVRRSPGVPSRAPIGDVLCPLLVCAAVYVLYRHYAIKGGA